MAVQSKTNRQDEDLKRREELVGKFHYVPSASGIFGTLPVTVEDTYKKGGKSEVKSVSSDERSSDYSYVIQDLKKITLLSVIAFGAQLVLWYFLR